MRLLILPRPHNIASFGVSIQVHTASCEQLSLTENLTGWVQKKACPDHPGPLTLLFRASITSPQICPELLYLSLLPRLAQCLSSKGPNAFKSNGHPYFGLA